jgi:hypothetical protein
MLIYVKSDHDAAIAFIKCPKATSRSFTRDIWLYDQTDFVRFNQAEILLKVWLNTINQIKSNINVSQIMTKIEQRK